MFFGGDGKWSTPDYMLILALQIYEESLCRCGFPFWMGHNADAMIGGVAIATGNDAGHCFICEKVQGQDEDSKPEPGDIPRVVLDIFETYSPDN